MSKAHAPSWHCEARLPLADYEGLIHAARILSQTGNSPKMKKPKS
jgi:hypothetical protein